MKTYLLLIALLIIGCTATTIDADPGPEQIRIELSPSNRLAIGDIDDIISFSPKDQDGFDRFFETIEHLPSQYTVKDTFFICVQPEQETYLRHGADKDDRQYFDSDGTSVYSDSPVDCIISVCSVIDDTDTEYVIIDTNNDEDLTNDPVLVYVENTAEVAGKEYSYLNVHTDVSVDYYDGETARSMILPICFYRTAPVSNSEYYCRIDLLQTGEIEIAGKRYTVGLPIAWKIELSRSTGIWRLHGGQRVWIDLNRNGRFEWDDFYDSIDDPVTIFGATYRNVEHDRFGRYIVLERMDSETHPPIAIGLPAPVFKGETIDGNTFDLAEKQGQYVLMDFWGSWCGPCISELPNLKTAHAQFGGKMHFVSIGVEDDRNELVSCIEEHDLGWTHLYSPFDGLIPERYQVHSYPSMFLIGPDGTLVAEGTDLRGKNLIPTLEKFLK